MEESVAAVPHEGADSFIIHRFIRDPKGKKLAVPNEHCAYPEFAYRLCRYRPNVSKDRKLLWKLDEVLGEDFTIAVVDRHELGGKQMVKQVGDKEQWLDVDNYENLYPGQMAKFQETWPGTTISRNQPCLEVWFKGCDYFYTDSRLKAHMETRPFWVPTPVSLQQFGDIRVEKDDLSCHVKGLHNKPVLVSDLSMHERARFMKMVRDKGWITGDNK